MLIYSVAFRDLRRPLPVAIHPREDHGLDDAPHRVGNRADIEDEKGAHLHVKVLSRTGPAWDVEISFTPAPQD